jgi:hypothetical protein
VGNRTATDAEVLMSAASMNDLERYYPALDPSGKPIETALEYVQRMQDSLLPNMPPNVLENWFYRHFANLRDYAWLDYSTLQFNQEPVEWVTDEVPIQNCGVLDVIERYATAFERRSGSYYNLFHNPWLENYMEEHGTWPQPVIFFDNYDGLIPQYDESVPIGKPYHLLEGHRRLAYFWILKRRNALIDRHQVWVATKPRAQLGTAESSHSHWWQKRLRRKLGR